VERVVAAIRKHHVVGGLGATVVAHDRVHRVHGGEVVDDGALALVAEAKSDHHVGSPAVHARHGPRAGLGHFQPNEHRRA
jgi:hypothetical protein